MARLIVAGLPRIDVYERTFLTTEARGTLGVKAAPAAVAKDELRGVDGGIRAAVVAALLPADPARLWTEGPDVAAAAEVWNSEVGRLDGRPRGAVRRRDPRGQALPVAGAERPARTSAPGR